MATYHLNTTVSIQVCELDGLHSFLYEAGDHEISDADAVYLLQYAPGAVRVIGGVAPAISASIALVPALAPPAPVEAVPVATPVELAAPAPLGDPTSVSPENAPAE